jgi:hypothetical protein
MYGDVNVLLKNPELVADTWLNLASALFFYIYPQTPKPSMLQVMNGEWQPNAADIAGGRIHGFGVTTMVINGGVECGGSVEVQQSVNRIKYYREFAAYMNVEIPADEKMGCANMQQFDEYGSGSVNTYWETHWTKEFECQIVNYQTRHNALYEGDYERCVKHYWPEVVIDEDMPETQTVESASASKPLLSRFR